MKPKVTAILIVTALLLGASSHLIALRVSAQANAPVLTIGDFWEYDTKSYYHGLMMEGSEKLTMDGSDNMEIGGTNYSVYIFDIEGEGSYEGTSEGIYMRGDWTGDGTVYYNKTDFKLLKSDLNLELHGMWKTHMAGSMHMTASNMTIYRPISNDWNFPIKINKAGESHTKIFSFVITNLDLGSGIPDTEYYESFHYYENITYFCSGTVTVTVPVGTFETYQIEMEKEDGSYYNAWFSPEVGNYVKNEYYDENGVKVASEELIAYYYHNAIEDTSMEYLLYIILIVVVGAVIAAAGLIAMNRWKRRAVKILVKKPQEQPNIENITEEN